MHNENIVLGSFAVAPGKMGYMKAKFQSKEPYQSDKDLTVRLVRDDEWRKFQKSPSCTEKVPYSSINEHVTFQKKVITKDTRKGTKKETLYEAEIAMPLDNEKKKRVRYFYFVVTDCSLEFYMHDDTIPKIHYRVESWNNGSTLSADESHLQTLHTITLLISGILAVLLGLSIVTQLYEKSSVHAAMIWVMVAAATDAFSSFLELVHLYLYAGNGVGSYFLDALSAYMEAICDSLVCLLLLSVAVGWTLPSDFIAVQQKANFIQKAMSGLQSPFGTFTKPSSTGVLACSIFLLHVLLAQWGRVYNDEFDSYHDLEHLPGKVLMFFRLVLGFLFLGGCFQTKLRCPISLQTFYVRLAMVGTFWFWSLPIMTWIVNTVVSYHLRHFSVGVWGAVCQSSSIVLLSWLVTSQSTSYHKFSHLSAQKSNLTESLSSSSSEGPKAWSIIGKTKVRLD